MSTEWKLVPMHPTEEMIQATLDTGLYHDGEEAARAVLIDEYKAMVKAAPPAPQAASEPVAWPSPDPRFVRLVKAAIDLIAAVDENLDTKNVPLKYTVPWGAVTNLRNCLDGTAPPASVAGLSGDAEREALIERLKAQSLAHRYEAETDSADLIDEAVAALHSTGKPDVEGRLKKEARVGHTTFGIGVPERFVIDAAQRAAEHPQGLVDKEAAAGLQRIIQENAERAAFLDSHPAVSAELAALIEENERLLTLLAATADAPVAEPVAVVVSFGDLGGTVDWARNYRCPVGTKLYIRPPAPEEAKDAARRDLLQRCLKALEHFEKVRTRVLYGAAYAQHRRLINDVNAALSQGGGA